MRTGPLLCATALGVAAALAGHPPAAASAPGRAVASAARGPVARGAAGPTGAVRAVHAVRAVRAVRAAAAAGAACLQLPAVVTPALPAGNVVGATPERLATSTVPGPVHNIEHVRVAIDAAGAPVAVSVDQTLELTGSGDYVVYERGPARSVVPLAQTAPPTLKLGRVTWAGYVPRAETLAARLGLDPTIETARLPLQVSRTGETVTLTNATALPDAVLDVAPVPAGALAGPLDLLLAQARAHDPRPAVAGSGLPTTLACDGGRPTGAVALTTVAPLLVTGTLGPGTAGPGAAGGMLTGLLADVPATFTVTALRPRLLVAPSLDPRTLTPPAGFATWAAWAASAPGAAARTAASETLMEAAAAAARIREIEPYLAADLPGTADTDFTFVRFVAPAAALVARPPTARPLPITLAALAAVLLAGTAVGLARRL